jgi:hypothetical protein
MTAPQRANRKKIKDKDFELIRAINSGQFDRFPDLVKRYEQKLYNFGLRMCRDAADAEDTVQETFLKRPARASKSGENQNLPRSANFPWMSFYPRMKPRFPIRFPDGR